MLNINRLRIENIWRLPGEGRHNGSLIDAKSAELMYKIEAQMNRLEVMGDDNRRILWLDFQGPKKHEDYWEHFDENSVAWYQIMTAQYKDEHYLYFSDGEGKLICYVDKPGFGSNYPYDISKPLTRIAGYVKRIVDAIVRDPKAYNEYVAEHLPYSKREGLISRNTLYSILPIYRRIEDEEQEIELLEEMRNSEYFHPDKITLNSYAHYWRIGYEAYRKYNPSYFRGEEDYSKMTDRELFVEHSNKGYDAQDYDWDSEEAFWEWEKANTPYHNLDIAYARIHFVPRKDKSGKNYFDLYFSSYGYMEDVLLIARAYHDAGINVRVEPYDKMMGILRETDYVRITPFRSHYLQSDNVGNEITLPYVREEISQEQINRLIDATKWEPLSEVRPV